MNNLKIYLKLYLDFFKNQYNSTEKFLEQRKKEILTYPNEEYGLIYFLDKEKEYVIEINFSLKRLAYFVNTDLVNDEEYTEEDFLELLKNMSFDSLISKFSEYKGIIMGWLTVKHNGNILEDLKNTMIGKGYSIVAHNKKGDCIYTAIKNEKTGKVLDMYF